VGSPQTQLPRTQATLADELGLSSEWLERMESVPLDSLVLSESARRSLSDAGVVSAAHVARLPRTRLLRIKNIGEGRLGRIVESLMSLRTSPRSSDGSVAHADSPLDWSSPETLAVSVLATMGFRDRDRSILIRRFGLDGDEPTTLAETGRLFGLSNQRVLQVQSKAASRLRSLPYVELLRPLDDAVRARIRTCGGVAAVWCLCVDLGRAYGWQDIRPSTVRALLHLLPGAGMEERKGIVSEAGHDGEPCAACVEKALGLLDGRGGRMRLEDFVDAAAGWNGNSSQVTKLAAEIGLHFAQLLPRIELDGDSITLHGRKVAGTRRPLTDAIRSALEAIGRTATCKEIASLVREFGGDFCDCSDWDVYHCLYRTPGFVAIDRGRYALADWISVDHGDAESPGSQSLDVLSARIQFLYASGDLKGALASIKLAQNLASVSLQDRMRLKILEEACNRRMSTADAASVAEGGSA